MLNPNTILQNRYQVVRPLGEGGMGAVYEAFDLRLSRTVALKETLVETDDLRRAFEREAQLLANLRHPALPKVLDHFSEENGLFLVMEFIPGDDLATTLMQGRAFAPDEVLRWSDQLLNALEYLHTLNPPVLHRDIKPGNLKLIGPGQIILLDFGLAKGATGQMAHTENKSVLGYSPNYSPLEQIRGAGTDQRSDLYSLGATLYHLLTGLKPPDALTRATSVVNGQPDPLRPAHEFKKEVPAAVSAALMRAMALNIEYRPRTASEMREDLRHGISRAAATVPIVADDETTKISLPANTGREIKSGPTQGQSRRPPVVVPVPSPEETLVTKGEGRSGRKWVIASVLLVGLAVLGVTLYMSQPKREVSKRRQPERPVVKRGSPTPSPTSGANINQPAPTITPVENINSQPEPANDPGQLIARAKLAERNIAYNEESFTRAIEMGDPSAVDLFLNSGMDPNVKSSTGQTALITAAAQGSDNISQKLLSKGADVNAVNVNGSTALMEASLRGHEDTVKVLLESGADVNMTNSDGQTALLRAAANGHSGVVRQLLDKGARIDIKDKDGRDALTLAEMNNHPEVANILKKALANR